jgi:pimeloyl-ACP methyl ester carboxylesterase
MTDHARRTWMSADGLALFARDYPGADGPARLPVICLHGLTRNSRDFEALAPWIAQQGRRVLAPDVRGRGLSAWDPHPLGYNPGSYAADVIGLLDQAGVRRAVFIGTSMGGLITMAVAAARPDLVAAAALNDVGPELDPAGLARIGAYVGQAPPVRTWAEAAAYARAVNGAALPHLPEDRWETFARRIFRPDGDRLRLDYDPAIAEAFRHPTPTPDLWPLFLGLAAGRPLLLIRGGASDLMNADIAARMTLAAPHMREAVVAGIGHAPLLDEPEALAALGDLLDAAALGGGASPSRKSGASWSSPPVRNRSTASKPSGR